MTDTTKAVEKKDGAAATDQKVEVKKEDGGASTQPIDYQAELAAKDAELAKVREERENYRKGMLKAKGKAGDSGESDDDELSLDEKIDRKVEERLLATQEAKILKEKDELLGKALKENRELRTSLQNRNQISNNSQGGSNETKIEVGNQFFSDAQIAELKSKGWDDKKIEMLKKNVLRGKA